MARRPPPSRRPRQQPATLHDSDSAEVKSFDPPAMHNATKALQEHGHVHPDGTTMIGVT
jgi:hypothetical protein